MPETITGIEIIFNKPVMYIEHVSRYPDIQWAYSMNAEYFLTRQFVTAGVQNRNIEPNWN
jgi:hypothetical protein